jgi:hypothetical protein
LLAFLAMPAHAIDRGVSSVTRQLGVGWIPGALVVGLAIALLCASSIAGTLAAYEARPAPMPAEFADAIGDGVTSGEWILTEIALVDGPRNGTTQPGFTSAYYLVSPPDDPAHAMVARAVGPPPDFDESGDTATIDGIVSEERFNLGLLVGQLGFAERVPGVEIDSERILSIGARPVWQEPSWGPSIVLAILALLIAGGAAVPRPLFRPRERRRAVDAGDPPAGMAAGTSPMADGPSSTVPLRVEGTVPTPRGQARADADGELTWMPAGEVARMSWRYWGAGLGATRSDLERPGGSDGDASELVVHSATGSILWPVARDAGPLEIVPGDAFVGLRRLPAIRVHGPGVRAVLQFARREDRDRALAAISAHRAAATAATAA